MKDWTNFWACRRVLISWYQLLGCSWCIWIFFQDVNIPTLAATSDAASESVIRCKEPIKSSIQFGSISNNIFGNNVAMTKGTLVTKEVPEINAQLNEPSEHDIAIKGNSSMMINSLGEASDCHRMELKNADIVANKSRI